VLFPVYRTYIRQGEVSEQDRQFICRAAAQAKRRNPARNPALFDFIRDVLLLETPPELDQAGILNGDVRGALSAGDQPDHGEGHRRYRLLPAFSLGVGSAKSAAIPRAALPCPRNSTGRTSRGNRSGRILLCTSTHDTNAARTCGRGSTCFRKSPRCGERPSTAGRG